MALPSSGNISLNDIYTEAVAGGYASTRSLNNLISWGGWTNLPPSTDSIRDFLGVRYKETDFYYTLPFEVNAVTQNQVIAAKRIAEDRAFVYTSSGSGEGTIYPIVTLIKYIGGDTYGAQAQNSVILTTATSLIASASYGGMGVDNVNKIALLAYIGYDGSAYTKLDLWAVEDNGTNAVLTDTSIGVGSYTDIKSVDVCYLGEDATDSYFMVSFLDTESGTVKLRATFVRYNRGLNTINVESTSPSYSMLSSYAASNDVSISSAALGQPSGTEYEAVIMLQGGYWKSIKYNTSTNTISSLFEGTSPNQLDGTSSASIQGAIEGINTIHMPAAVIEQTGTSNPTSLKIEFLQRDGGVGNTATPTTNGYYLDDFNQAEVVRGFLPDGTTQCLVACWRDASDDTIKIIAYKLTGTTTNIIASSSVVGITQEGTNPCVVQLNNSFWCLIYRHIGDVNQKAYCRLFSIDI